MILRRVYGNIAVVMALLATASQTSATSTGLTAAEYQADALAFEGLVNERYAYLDRFEGGSFKLTERLEREALEVHDASSLLTFLEHGIALMADHHAITGSSRSDSWGLVPSYADIWVVKDQGGYRISEVKPTSRASELVQKNDYVSAIDGVPVEGAVAKFWSELGVVRPDQNQQEFAARVLLAGRRDRLRNFTLRKPGGALRTIELANLYTIHAAADQRKPLTVTQTGRTFQIRINDSLGETATITAFDSAMAQVGKGDTVVIDLSNTGSGGNSTIARAMLGWFVNQAQPYQMHASPEESRQTGIARQWAEYVLPRPGKHHSGLVIVKVGRWTGSMGEGLAVGFATLGKPVCGSPMAGLLGAIEDVRLQNSRLVVKFATERLSTIQGVPREAFQPRPLGDRLCAAVRKSDQGSKADKGR